MSYLTTPYGAAQAAEMKRVLPAKEYNAWVRTMRELDRLRA